MARHYFKIFLPNGPGPEPQPRPGARPGRESGPRPETYCMGAPTMQLELHERGTHAV